MAMSSSSSSSSSGEISDWAWLPKNLLDSILNKLVPLSDQVRFGAVCLQWHSVAVNYTQSCPKPCQNQPPMLMIPTEDNSREKRGLYSISERKILGFQLPIPFNKRCCGSSHGWLAFVKGDDLAITLLNPFTGGTIYLPPIRKLKDDSEEASSGVNFKSEYEINKVILSTDPSLSPQDYEVTAIHGMFKLAFIKVSDKTWTFFENSNKLSDIIYYQGQVHAVDHWCEVISIDYSTKKPTEKATAGQMSNCTAIAYLVESSGGDLLVVRRLFRFNRREKVARTSEFKVYKLVVSCGKLKRVGSLGGDALFLGDNYSMSVIASDFPGCQPNSIYFTDDLIEIDGFRDMGIFNLDNGRMGMHYTYNPSHKNMPPPIWIVPKLHQNMSSNI